MRRSVALFGTMVLIAAAAGAVWAWPRLRAEFGPGMPSAATIALGQSLYADHCASCHGANLEGQPNWQSRLPSGRMPAPPHDASGHTWHHSDGVLFRITKEGPAAVVGGGYESDMPAFSEILSDDGIWAVLAYVKSTWPERARNYQEDMGRRERESGQ